MNPPVRFPDAQLAGRNLLRELLADRPEMEGRDVAEAVTAANPRTENLTTMPLPHVVVRLESSTRDDALNGAAVLRITVWHRDEGASLNLAHVAEALLLAAQGHGITSVGPRQSPIPTTDPASGVALAFFRAEARLEPENL